MDFSVTHRLLVASSKWTQKRKLFIFTYLLLNVEAGGGLATSKRKRERASERAKLLGGGSEVVEVVDQVKNG